MKRPFGDIRTCDTGPSWPRRTSFALKAGIVSRGLDDFLSAAGEESVVLRFEVSEFERERERVRESYRREDRDLDRDLDLEPELSRRRVRDLDLDCPCDDLALPWEYCLRLDSLSLGVRLTARLSRVCSPSSS